MAAAPDPVKVLRSTSEKENFHRLARLLVGGGTLILREVFDSIHPPSHLPTLLSASATKTQLKAAKLTMPQWNCLYPSSGVYGKSTDFDITLLFRLLRTICNLSPPTTGWDALPACSDHSLTADLARVKNHRNSVYGHVGESMEVTDDEFLSLWQEISETLLRIAGQINRRQKIKWQRAIDNLLKDPLTVEVERNVEELRQWYRRDMKVKKSLENLKSTTEDVQDRMGRLESTMKDIKDQMIEMNQSMARLDPLASGFQSPGAQMKLIIDCKATAGLGRRRQGSGLSLGTQKIQAGVQGGTLRPAAISPTGFSGENVGNGAVRSAQDVLSSIAFKLFQAIDPSKPEELSDFVTYLKEVRNVLLIDVQTGSLILTVECSSLQILNELWIDYCSGHLSEMAQKFLVTEDILTKFGLSKVELTTTILEEEYNECREYFLKPPGARPGTVDVYKMTATPRGIALIINNKLFADHPEYDMGRIEDVRKVESLFGTLGFDVHARENLTRPQFLKELDSVARQDHRSYDCFVLWLMSHGESGVVFCSDGEPLPIQSVLDILSNCETLRAKPKLVFIQAYRGHQKDKGPVIMTDEPSPACRGIPSLHLDFLYLYATVDEYESHSHSDLGSYFVRALVDVFRERAAVEDILNILRATKRKIEEMMSKASDKQCMQLPKYISTLRKKLLL